MALYGCRGGFNVEPVTTGDAAGNSDRFLKAIAFPVCITDDPINALTLGTKYFSFPTVSPRRGPDPREGRSEVCEPLVSPDCDTIFRDDYLAYQYLNHHFPSACWRHSRAIW